METRLILAYAIIALFALAAAILGFVLARRRQAHRRLMRGEGRYP